MHKTQNSLPEEQRAKLVKLLNRRLADSIDLMSQAKQAHWNVKGPQFMSLHQLFGQIADEVLKYIDLLAERIVQLGGSAEGTVHTVARRTSLARYPFTAADGNSHAEALTTALATFNKHIRYAIGQSTDLVDAVSANLFIEISRGVDGWLRLVEAHLQTTQ